MSSENTVVPFPIWEHDGIIARCAIAALQGDEDTAKRLVDRATAQIELCGQMANLSDYEIDERVGRFITALDAEVIQIAGQGS